jgi:AcrR family transcriptional regulator
VRVSEVQRARVLAGMVGAVAEYGAGSVTVARVVGRAGVSRRTFYELFGGCEECFLAVFDDAVERASTIVSEAVMGVSLPVSSSSSWRWRERVRAGLSALLVLFDGEPALGSLLVVDALGAGPRVLQRRARVLENLTAILDQGRAETKGGGRGRPSSSSSSSSSRASAAPSLTAEGVVGAVLSVIHARMLQRATNSENTNGSYYASRSSLRAPGQLLGLLNPLMAMIVLPYLGQAAAQKELARPIPRTVRAPRSSARAPRAAPPENPLRGLNMRLTYRTLRVLSVIATNPGASNREIAEEAGIHDQGQISKLLARLERLELIHNNGQGQPRGEPNAWTLTPTGTHVEQALASGG